MKIKYEKEINNCCECPFRYYLYEPGGCKGYVCIMREKLNNELYPFIDEEKMNTEIDSKCPFLKEEN